MLIWHPDKNLVSLLFAFVYLWLSLSLILRYLGYWGNRARIQKSRLKKSTQLETCLVGVSTERIRTRESKRSKKSIGKDMRGMLGNLTRGVQRGNASLHLWMTNVMSLVMVLVMILARGRGRVMKVRKAPKQKNMYGKRPHLMKLYRIGASTSKLRRKRRLSPRPSTKLSWKDKRSRKRNHSLLMTPKRKVTIHSLAK